MKKAKVILVLVAFILMSLSRISYGCTSFAVFSTNNLYGMNFDYPETEIRIIIHQTELGKAIALEFKEGNEYIPFVGMNSKGLLVASQMLYPNKQPKEKLEKNEIYIGELGSLIGVHEKVGQIENYILDKKLVNMPITIHKLFADKYGDSMIVEVGDYENNIVKTNENFIVMTNFSNSNFIDKDYHEVYGVGADRFKIAYEHIKDNFDEFDIDSGWEVLKRTVQPSGSYPTLCSMMFNPESGDIYIALNRDFQKIWKISLENETIESLTGFEKPIEFKIEPRGILASELTNVGEDTTIISDKSENEIKASGSTNKLYWIFGLGFIFIFIGGIMNKRNIKKKF